jgi:hypothetical protein
MAGALGLHDSGRSRAKLTARKWRDEETELKLAAGKNVGVIGPAPGDIRAYCSGGNVGA